MPSDHSKLAPPHLLMDYRGAVQITFLYDDVEMNSRQAVGFIHVPECPVYPLVILQPVDDSGRANGAAWAYDPEGNRSRGAWNIYDPEFNEIPKSQPLAEAGTDSLQLDDEVELTEEDSPASLDPPFDDDDELDEPSDDDLDEDEEDEVTAS